MKTVASAALISVWPENPAVRRLSVVALVDSVGTGIYLGGSVVLFTRIVGLSAAEVGQGLALAGAVGLLATLGWGGLADRVGPRATLVVIHLLRALGFAAYLMVHGFPSFLAVTVYLGLLEKAMPPVMMAVVSAALDEVRRVHTLAALRSLRNLGLTVGTLLSSLALLAPGRLGLAVVMLLNALSFVLAGLVLARVPLLHQPTTTTRPRGGWATILRRPRFLALTLLNGVLALHLSVLSVGLPLWVVAQHGVASAVVPLFIAVNTVLAVVLQVRFSRGCERPVAAGAALRRAGIASVVLAGLFAISGHAPALGAIVLLAIAVVALTAAELWQSAGGWGLALALAPSAAQGRALSVFALGSGAVEALGILLLGTVIIGAGPLGWWALAAVFALAAMFAVPFTRAACDEHVRAEARASPGEPVGRR
ncbi:MAG: MFS transporter [Pseudonocardiaceae bacterium]